MDYEKFFSEDVAAFLPSPTRELFKKVDISKIYSLAGGFPSPDTFPLEGMGKLVAEVLHRHGAKAMQYGGTQGVPELLRLLSERTGEPIENLQVTTSSQQGIDVCARVLLNPGETVLIDTPTYLGALQSFRDYRAVTVPFKLGAGNRPPVKPASNSQKWCGEMRQDGKERQEGKERLDSKEGQRGSWASIETASFSGPVKFAYVIADFSNPSGRTMSLEERESLVALARKEDFLIVEDSPYRALRFEGADLPSIRSLAPERTVQLCSFSKIFAPGFRLGWMAGPPEIIRQVYVCKQALDLCPPVFDQYLASEFIGSGALDKNLEKSKGYYRRNRDLLLAALEKYMPAEANWTHPEGGFFIFVSLPESYDTLALYETAIKKGIAYVPGSFFYPDGGGRNTMRLSFSYLAPEKFDPAVKLLAELLAG